MWFGIKYLAKKIHYIGNVFNPFEDYKLNFEVSKYLLEASLQLKVYFVAFLNALSPAFNGKFVLKKFMF